MSAVEKLARRARGAQRVGAAESAARDGIEIVNGGTRGLRASGEGLRGAACPHISHAKRILHALSSRKAGGK